MITSLTVFFPAFNDEATLPGLVEKAFDVLRQTTNDYELIVVNDGSWDGTAAVLEQPARVKHFETPSMGV